MTGAATGADAEERIVMQTAIVVLIVAAAAIYVGRLFYKGLKAKEPCACGCSCCDVGDTCEEPATPANKASNEKQIR